MKFLTIVVIIAGIIFLFNAGGIETTSGGLVSSLITDGLSAFRTGELWSKLTIIFTLALGVGAVASLFGRAPDVSWVLAGFASFFGGLVLADMISIYQTVNSFGVVWISNAILLIMGLLIYGFFISLISFWRGVDD